MDYKEITNRIDELNLDGYKHIKNNDWEIPRKLTDWLIDKGFELEGEGSYSSVYSSKTENFVVKINKGYIDEGYLKFIEFCHKNKGNKHLPKVGQVKKYKDWYIIFIEKLSNQGEYDTGDIAEDIENLALIPDSYEKNIKDIDSNYSSNEIKKQIIDCSKLLKNFLNSENKTYSDLHGENIMFRGDTIVITDPAV